VYRSDPLVERLEKVEEKDISKTGGFMDYDTIVIGSGESIGADSSPPSVFGSHIEGLGAAPLA